MAISCHFYRNRKSKAVELSEIKKRNITPPETFVGFKAKKKKKTHTAHAVTNIRNKHIMYIYLIYSRFVCFNRRHVLLVLYKTEMT